MDRVELEDSPSASEQKGVTIVDAAISIGVLSVVTAGSDNSTAYGADMAFTP
jgi:hypothetical protein